jgi:hypothetical protein
MFVRFAILHRHFYQDKKRGLLTWIPKQKPRKAPGTLKSRELEQSFPCSTDDLVLSPQGIECGNPR